MTTVKKKTRKSSQFKNIAKARGIIWKANLKKGRRDALLHPSLIRLSRLAKSLEQTSVASKLKISTSAWGAIERGRQPVKSDRAKEIAKILGKPVAKLFKTGPKSKLIAALQKSAV